MPRATTTSDVFNAIAEPRRRDIIDFLVDGNARPVRELVDHLELAQPAVSKHLAVLRKLGIVSVTSVGPIRLYRLEPQQLKPVYDWVRKYEEFWSHQISKIKERAEKKASLQAAHRKAKEET